MFRRNFIPAVIGVAGAFTTSLMEPEVANKPQIASFATEIPRGKRDFPIDEKLSKLNAVCNGSVLATSACTATNFSPPVGEDPDVSVISGTSNRELSQRIAMHLKRKLSDVDIKRFADGEISIVINESMRGKDVFILQSCAPPVNDSVMELLLSIAAAKRSGANSVTAVIPYYGYKLNRRGIPISTTHHSRFLWNGAGDLAKMLLVLGVDKVVSVDLQRAGQGHEACFFNTALPAETITTNDLFVEYLNATASKDAPLVVVSPNTELVKRAKKIQSKLSNLRPQQSVECAAFLRSDSDLSYVKGAPLELQGDVRGRDVILIEDYIDSALHISILCNRLIREGANKVTICASHAFFEEESVRLLNLSQIHQVVVTDSIPLPASGKENDKIVQLSIAPLLAKVIDSDATSAVAEFNPDTEEEQYVME